MLTRRARLLIAGFLVGSIVLVARAQDAKPATRPGKDMFGPMLAALKASPGCLSVVVSPPMDNGQAAIFAFFENKKAAVDWYFNPVHQRLVHMIAPDMDPAHKPMADVPDGVPVMAVATITMGGKPAIEGSNVPFSQISIELFTPLSGGLNFGGGFSPDKFREGIKPLATTQPSKP